MPDFDEQWKKVMEKENFSANNTYLEFNPQRVKDFLNYTGIKPWFKKDSWIKGKICLDAGCGPGRWTYAMQKLGASKVDSFDLSPEAIKRCKEINPDAHVYMFDIGEFPCAKPLDTFLTRKYPG